MLQDLTPFKTGNGLVGRYITKQGNCCFAVLLTENMNEDVLFQTQFDANTEVSDLRRLSLSSGKSGSITDTAKTNFLPPEALTLSHGQNIRKLMNQNINGDNDIILSCTDHKAYIEACSYIGITRADHLACAEMHGLKAIETSKKKYVAGEAHKIRDELIKLCHGTHQFMNNSKALLVQEIAEKAILDISEATKFQLGDVQIKPVTNNLNHRPWLFKLPFKKCLFEASIPLENSNENRKIFILAQEDEADLFSAQSFYWNKEGKITIEQHLIHWDISKNKLAIGYENYDKHINSLKNQDIQRNAIVIAQAFLPFIAKLNDLTSELKIITPHKNRVQIGKQKRSPFYDYHTLTPNMRTIGSQPDENLNPEPRRLHQRRGHYRTYTHPRYVNLQGKRKWIDDKEWGEPEEGVIGKEYNLEDI